MAPSISYQELLASMYYNASLAGTDMVEFASIIESLKRTVQNESNVLSHWTHWDNAVIQSKPTRALDTLIQTRTEFALHVAKGYAQLIAEATNTLEEVFFEYLYVWRTVHFKDVLQVLQSNQQISAEEELFWTNRVTIIEERRWVEMIPVIQHWITSPHITAPRKAHFLSVLAAIYIFYVGDYKRSKTFLDEAILLHETEPYVQSVHATWYLEQNLIEDAKSRYQQMVLDQKMLVIGYNGLGNCARKQEDFFTAEEWYFKAKASEPGYLETYQNLISLYGAESKLYEVRKDQISAYVDTELLIEINYAIHYYLDAANACITVNDIEAAKQWHAKAAQENKLRVDVLLQAGSIIRHPLPADLSNLTADAAYLETEKVYKEAMLAAPTCFDPYWALYILYKQASCYEAAIAVLKQAYPFSEVFQELCIMEITTCYESLQQWQQASENLLEGIKAFPDSQALFEYAEFYSERLAQHDATSNINFEASKLFYHQLCAVIPEQRKQDFYTFFTKSIADKKQDEDFLIAVYEDALLDFPNNTTFRKQVERIKVLRTVFDGGTPYNHTITEIAVECDSRLCDLFLTPERNDFTPAFWQKLNQFKEAFHQRFGVALPAIIFREYTFHSEHYDFYSTLQEVYTNHGIKFHADCILVRGALNEVPVIETCYAYAPYFILHWVKEEYRTQIPSSCVILEPVDVIFEHLQYTLWNQLHRFMHYDQANFKTVTEQADRHQKTAFMQCVQLLLQYKVSMQNLPSMYTLFLRGLEANQAIQEIAYHIMSLREFPLQNPYNDVLFTWYTLSAENESQLTSVFKQTLLHQWAADMDATSCQTMLTYFRNTLDKNARVIVQHEQTAFVLQLICAIEFPNVLFGTSMMFQTPENELNNAQMLQWS